jgi:hypothetical protein
LRRALQVVEVEPAEGAAVGVRGEHDDPRRRAVLEQRQQLLREHEVPEVVDAEGGLEAVDRLGALAEDQAGVVDQHVEARVAGAELRREGADPGERGEVEAQALHRVVAGLAADLRERRLALLGAA